jgi:hypothetical protein
MVPAINKLQQIKRLLFAGALLLLFVIPAGAIDIVDHTQAEKVMQGNKEAIPLFTEEAEEVFDQKHEQLGEYLVSAATWFDSFFDNSRAEAEVNKSTARLRLDAGRDKYENFKFKPRVSFRLHLPGINKRWNLLLSARDDEDFDVDRHPGGTNRRDDDANITAALQYFMMQTEKMNISTTAGISYNYAYAGLRYRGSYEYGSWQARLTSRFRYYTDDGFESINEYDIERRVSENLLFRTTLNADWNEEKRGLPHGIVFSLFQVLNSDRAILYDFGNSFQTSPSYHHVDIVLRSRYRQRFYRDWLIFEIAPQVSFPKEHDRNFNPGLIVRLEAEFGYKSYKKQFDNIFRF